jgi:hypothetical protein
VKNAGFAVVWKERRPRKAAAPSHSNGREWIDAVKSPVANPTVK